MSSRVIVPPEVGAHHAGVHRVGVDPEGGEAAVELDGVEHVGRLGLPVGLHLVEGAVLEREVVPDDVGGAVAAGAQEHDAGRSTGDEQRDQPAHEHEVAHVVGAEVELEAVVGAPVGREHDPGVGDEEVEPVVGSAVKRSVKARTLSSDASSSTS